LQAEALSPSKPMRNVITLFMMNEFECRVWNVIGHKGKANLPN